MNEEYREAIAETLDVLEHTRSEDVDKISKRFMDFLRKNASKTYISNLDHTKNIEDMKLKDKTIGILAVINKKFWCNAKEKTEFDKKLKENEIKYQDELRKKYNPDSLFKNKQKGLEKENVEEVKMIEYKENSIFSKIKKIVKKLFKH